MKIKRHTLIYIIIIGAILALHTMLLLCRSTAQAMSFLAASAPTAAASVLMLLYISDEDSPYAAASVILFCFLAVTGTALQLMNGSRSVFKLLLDNTAAVGVAAACLMGFRCFLKGRLNSKARFLYAMYADVGVMTSLILILLLFAPQVNGARNWLFIGSHSIQLTELIKLLFFLFLYLLVQCEQSVFFKLRTGLITLFLLGLGFAALNELATFVVMLLSFIWVSFVYFNTRVSICMLALTVIASAAVFFLISGYYPTAAAKESPGMFDALIVKAYDRIAISDRYQQNSALKMMINGGLFGCDPSYTIYVFAEESDFALASLCQYYGIIFCVATIAGTALIPAMTAAAAKDSELNNTSDFKLAVIAGTILSSAALLNAGSCAGVIGACGIGFPFLSAGGTQGIVDLTLAAFIATGFCKKQSASFDWKSIFIKRRTRRYYHEKHAKEVLYP